MQSNILDSTDYYWSRSYVGKKSIKEKGTRRIKSSVLSELAGTKEEIVKKLTQIEEEIMRLSDNSATSILFYRSKFRYDNWLEVSWLQPETDEEFEKRVEKYNAEKEYRKSKLA